MKDEGVCLIIIIKQVNFNKIYNIINKTFCFIDKS